MRAYRLSLHRSIFALALVALLVITGCRSVARVQPTTPPTPTYTPRSTPLPTIATPPPPGSEDNPIALVFGREASQSNAGVAGAVDGLETVLLESYNLTVDVRTVNSSADAVEALCGSPDGPPAAAWVNGVGYAAALARECAQPELLAERREGFGAEVVIIVNSATEIRAVSGLAGARFCRISGDDLYSWIVPSLLMRASGLSPTQLGGVEDVDDANALVTAVAGGDCDAAGIDAAGLERLGSSARIRQLDTTVNVPFSIFMISPVIPLGVRQTLIEALVTTAADAEQAEVLEPLLDQTRLVPISADALDGWNAFIRATRLDFNAMGN
ncbi:MAG: PhnD/SsuA/transferrin family substrate-binding protein [bacterium]|nr:PhnD/SsuA/transferrin family substrate-binding protein [bacterium]